jgi:hypothetical protein
MSQYRLSATSIAAFKTCPVKFRLGFIEGLKPDKDTESQRMGTNWHKLHELAGAVKGDEAAKIDAVIAHLNEAYRTPPISVTPFDWAVEREVLLQSFIGYLWRWTNDPVEILASEIPFELPLMSPKVNLPLPTSDVVRVGKIDHIVRWQGAVCNLERKSTSRSITSDSDYWDKAKKDTQVSMYALAFKDMPRLYDRGCPNTYTLAELWSRVGDRDIDSIPWFDKSERIGNTLYDVWHKPTIKPSAITQAETAEFIKTDMYCGRKFTVTCVEKVGSGEVAAIVDGEPVTIEMGKRGYAFRETSAMFGARLLQDIQVRPDFYYQRREIVRTEAELEAFKHQLFAVYQAQKTFERSGCWFENEQQCRATFPCPFIPICYGSGSEVVCDGKTVPAGFRRHHVDVTVNGREIE